MKANRKFKQEDEAVSAVIGVILMVAITVAIAATVYVYVSGMLGGGPSTNPNVSMSQSGTYILISRVEGGPVNGSTGLVVQFINKSDATNILLGTCNYGQGTSPDNVDAGDIIPKPTSGLGPAGTAYTVNLIKGSAILGTCTYTVI